MLFYFQGYVPDIYYPKRTAKPLFENLVKQCSKMGLTLLDSAPDAAKLDKDYGLVVDALFGFSFRPPVREPFAALLGAVVKSSVAVASVDIPSGWDVEKGDVDGVGVKPRMLISLTAPKKCAKFFTGEFHYLGGRYGMNKVITSDKNFSHF